MILINSNRLLGYLLFLVVIPLSGCSSKHSSHPIASTTLDKDGTLFVKTVDKDGVLVVKTIDKDGVEFAQNIDKDGVRIAKKLEAIEKILLKKVAKNPPPIRVAPLKHAAKQDTRAVFTPKKARSITKARTMSQPIKKAPIQAAKVINKKPFFARETRRILIKQQESDSIWRRMFALYALPDIDNKRVDREIQRFLKHPEQLVIIQRRAEPYLHLIMDEIESKNIPGEIALLPIIESSYRANITSPASAAGLWQFIPSTGLSFGLKQNWWYDGRRDVYASTQAATEYLKKLSKSFNGDWFLALASYNVGIGNVKKAIRRNRRADYWSLRLPRETREYVPKLLALAKLFAQAEKYNLPLKSIPNKPFFKSVKINSQLGLKKAANMAQMNFDDFFILNPAFNRVVTPPNGSYRLLVKTKNAQNFQRNLAKLPHHERVDWVEHITKNGETLKAIARQHNIKIKDLLKVNHLTRKEIRHIEAGKTLKIPPASIKTLVKDNA